VIELSRYVLEELRKDEEFILYRGQSQDDQVLVLSPVAEYPRPESLKRLEHAYSLRGELDPAWAARPVGLARNGDRIALVLEDPGGAPLDQFGGFGETRAAGPSAHALDLRFRLRIGINLANAIGHLHRRGIVHKDVKPANVLVNSATGQVWLTGFGIASRFPRERQQSVNSLGTAATGRALNRYNAWAAIRKQAKAAGFLTPVGCHTLRATGITIYLENDGRWTARACPADGRTRISAYREARRLDKARDYIERGGANPAVTFIELKG
jgi:uncharacterized ParB-like nuclease family protein